LLLCLLLLVSLHAKASVKYERGRHAEDVCKAVMIHREAASEGLQGARAVLDVLYNRMRIDGLTACQAVAVKGQWSWYRANKPARTWKVSKDMWTRYHKVRIMAPVLTDNVYYFRVGKHKIKWLGRYCCRIGRHVFYYKS
jgi:hypothetical protein